MVRCGIVGMSVMRVEKQVLKWITELGMQSDECIK